MSKSLKPLMMPLILLLSIILGGLTGYQNPELALKLKPLGDIFLNLIFTIIVPLIFFSIASAVAKAGALGKLGKILGCMLAVFLFTGSITSIFSLAVVHIFPPAQDVQMIVAAQTKLQSVSLADQLVGIFTVPNFTQLLNQEHILALILFSLLVGLAVNQLSDKRQIVGDLLQAGEEVFLKVFSFIMYYAPIGFFAYFAVLVSELGPKILENYLRVTVIYYLAATLYFFIALSLYAFLAGKGQAVKAFWREVFLPAFTSIATCSSAASIPANLLATQKMGVPKEIYETSIPLGSIIHKDGSVMGGVFKIAFLFGIYHWDFTGAGVLLTAFGVSLLVGTVMGAIPSGGMLGELLILSVYGFPPSVLIVIAAISIIIDPIATLLNVTTNSVSSMLIARLVEGKNWLTKPAHS